MSDSINFDCIDNLSEKLKSMGRKGIKIQDRALTKSGEIILNEMKKTSKFQDRTGKLRKGLKISKPKTIKGVRTVKIGIQKDDNSEIFYGKFIEFGTTNGKRSIPPRPYMRPAFEKKKDEALEITKQEIRKGIKESV